MGSHVVRMWTIVGACLLAACVPQSAKKQASVLIPMPEPAASATQTKTVDSKPADSIAPTGPAADAATAAPSALLAGLPAADIACMQAEAKRIFARDWPLVAERSRLVRHRMLPVFAKLGAPPELQLLPVVESGYNPYALSPAGAMGLWQLMPGTARLLGIKRRSDIDGRRHIEQSTTAALRYLLRLHKRFRHWPLALAAYHLGPASVARRLKNQPWQPADGIDKLPVPKVTRTYVRLVLGLTALNHMGVLTLPEPLTTRILQVQGPVDLQKLAKAAGMEVKYLFQLNPGLEYSQYLHSSVQLHVPQDLFASIKAELDDAAPHTVNIRVKHGDSLWLLARRFGTTIAHLRRLNPGVRTNLRAGQSLRVPATRLVSARAAPNPLLTAGRRIRYRVKHGDNLWTIAKRFGTTPRSIARANRLSDPHMLRPGDTLWILARIRPS